MSYQVPERLNDDYTQAVVVHSADLPWTPSPMPGVERRFLERIGGEIAVATTIVRYVPGSEFPEHVHELGEEYFVLDGVFSDDDGDFPVGSYVRNPPGSHHAPRTGPGCTILVKLRQMSPAGEPTVRCLTAGVPLQPTPTEGLKQLILHKADETVALEELGSGARLPEGRETGGEEIYVLEGSMFAGDIRAESGTWLRFPPGASPQLTSSTGCRYWVKRGHLVHRIAQARGLNT